MSAKNEDSERAASSQELLKIKTDKSKKEFIKGLINKTPDSKMPASRLQTFKVERSSLFDKLNSFLPEFEKSNSSLLALPNDELEKHKLENTDGDEKVVEMNLLMGEMADSGSEDSEDEPEVTADSIKLPNTTIPPKRPMVEVVENNQMEENG